MIRCPLLAAASLRIGLRDDAGLCSPPSAGVNREMGRLFPILILMSDWAKV
jgi:hypothetical protein